MNFLKLFIFFVLSFNFLYPSIYDIGEVVSNDHQNLSYETCFGGNDYNIGDEWKLADWNGNLNGGNYNVIVIIMSASWWGSCYTAHNGPSGELHHEYADNNSVKFLESFTDPGQPYTCVQWGNSPQEGGSQIILDENVSPSIFTLFGTDNSYPSTVFIDHEMKVYDYINLPGSWSINSRLNSMLDECGSLCSPDDSCLGISLGDLNNDQITNINDIILIVNYILYDAELECIPDINEDGIVNISDIINVINIILSWL